MHEKFNSSQFETICREYGISYLGLFGSHARVEERSDSDVDLLVRFNDRIGYFGLLQTQYTLEELLGKKVDLVTENALSQYIKPHVYKDLKALYGS